MTTDYQAALIRRIKSRLRQDAGVPSFDPADPSLRSLPTLDEVVAGFDPSPAQFRCQKCRGRLLAGIRSHVCIYCGAQQRKDVLPPSMSFTSTFAYRGLLKSLELDGSEVVSLDTEKENSLGRQATAKKEILLSELLDFELKWPQGTESTDNSSESKVPVPSTNYANFAGVDLDNFFDTSKPVIASDRTNGQSTSDRSVSNEMVSIPSKEFTFDAFKETHDKPVLDINEPDGFSSWKAEFEPVASGSQTADANVTSFFSPTASSFFSTQEATEGAELNKGIQFMPENKNKAEETNELKHLPFSVENTPHMISVNAIKETKNINQTKASDDSLDDWQDFSGSTHISFSAENRSQDIIFESDTKETNSNNQTKGDKSIDDWQDFAGSSDAAELVSSSCPLTGGAFPHESAMQVNSIDNVQRPMDAESSKVVQITADSVDNFEGSNQLKQLSFVNPESDAFFEGKPQEESCNVLIKERDNLPDDWQDFTGSGDMSVPSSNAWPLAGSAVLQESTKQFNSSNLMQDMDTIDMNLNTVRTTIDAGSNVVLQTAGDSKDNIESNHLKPLPFPNSEFNNFLEEHTEQYKGNHLTKESENLVDDWQDFAGSGDMPVSHSSVWPLAGPEVSQESTELVQKKETININYNNIQQTVDAGSGRLVQTAAVSTEGIEESNQLKSSFSNFEFGAFIGDGPQESHDSGLTKESDNLLDDWQDFAGSGDMPEASSSAWSLAGSAVAPESTKQVESANSERQSIDTNCDITQRTVDLGSVKVAQIIVESKENIGKHKLSNQLSFSNYNFDSFFGGYSQEHGRKLVEKENDDSLDDWQDFAGSGHMSEPSSSVGLVASSSVLQESTTKTESDVGFTKYIPSDPFSMDLHLQKSSVDLNHLPSEPSFFNRKEDAGGMSDASSSGEALFKHGDSTSVTSTFDSTAANTNEKVERLISDMHDLSFMLESKLSIPGQLENSS